MSQTAIEPELNLTTWFVTREVKTSLPPKHFVKSSVGLSAEGKNWIDEKCIGRYFITPGQFLSHPVIFFEDPKELLMYELIYG